MAGLDSRKMIFQDLRRVGNCNRNDRAAAFLRQLQASFLEWHHLLRVQVARSLRENAHRDAVLNLINPDQNRRQPLADVVPVEKQAVETLHPLA